MEKKKGLFELGTEFAIIEDDLILAGGELDDDLEARLDSVNLALSEKSAGLVVWQKKLGMRVDAIDKEIKRLTFIKKSEKNRIVRIMDYMKRAMENAKLKKIVTDFNTITVCKCAPSVDVVDSALIPDTYIVEIPAETRPDKMAILLALKAGTKVAGANLITDKTRLSIK